MMKNILVLTGSHRKGGNSDKLADAFIRGAQQAGHNVIRFSTADKNLQGCIGCGTCFSKGAACSVPDDFSQLAPLLEAADMLVFATPVYWFTFPAPLKAAIEKLFAYFSTKRPLKIRSCALLCCGGSWPEESKYDGIIKTYQLTAQLMEWQDKGIIIANNTEAKDDILSTDGLQRAEALGRSL